MLPIVYVASVPLNGDYFTSMFIALAMDGNHEELVLAFGVGAEDTEESAKWFLTKLKNCFRNVTEIGFITEMFGSISTTINGVFPNSYHGFCYRSVIRNFQQIYDHNSTLEKLCKQTCHTYSMIDFQDHLSGLKNMLRLQNVWIETFRCDKWARAFFPEVRWNVMSMYIPQRIQRLAGERRSRPVTNLIEVILDDIRCTYLQRRDVGMNFGRITPYATNVLHRRIRKSRHLDANHRGDLYFEVNEFGHIENVCLNRKSCLCGKWKKTGIPCRHAIAALRSLNRNNFEEAVDFMCTSAIYRGAYRAQPVLPIPPPDQWVFPHEVIVLLPPV